jgi:DNA-directed RNA polymerase subunit RPC12/RpoP
MIIICPQCSRSFEVPDPSADSKWTAVLCESCGSRIEMGGPRPPAPSSSAADPVSPPRRGCSPVLKVAALGCFLFLALGGAGGIYVALNFKRLATDVARAAAVQAIRSSEMPRDVQDGFVGHIDRVARAYKEGRISTDQVMRIFRNVAESPLFPVAMVVAADRQYVQPSGLGAEEKHRASRDLQRLARGVAERSIPHGDLEGILDLVSSRRPGGGRHIRQKLSDAEVRALATRVKEVADRAGVPDEPYEIDCVAEFGKAIDREMGENRGEAEPPGEAGPEEPPPRK